MAQVPADVWTDVASGVGSERALAEERTDGAPLAEQATKATVANPKGPQVGRLMQKLVRTGVFSFSHRSLSTVLIVLASTAENDELVAAVAGPGSVSKT